MDALKIYLKRGIAIFGVGLDFQPFFFLIVKGFVHLFHPRIYGYDLPKTRFLLYVGVTFNFLVQELSVLINIKHFLWDTITPLSLKEKNFLEK